MTRVWRAAAAARRDLKAGSPGVEKCQILRGTQGAIVPHQGLDLDPLAVGGRRVVAERGSAFLDELDKLCRKLGIETVVDGDQRVYCLNVKMATALAGMADAAYPRSAYYS